MIRVKSAADLDKLAGRAPKAAPAPAPKPVPVPAPQQAAPAPAPSAIDAELRALLGAMAQNLTVATNLIAQQARAATQQAAIAPPLPAPEPMPAPAPPLPEPTVPRFVPTIPRPLPSEAMPEPMPAPEPVPTGPLEAVIVRDKKDRLLAVTITGAVPLAATIGRDSKKLMSTIAIERDGKKYNGTIHRDRKGRVEKITMTGA